MSISNRPKDPRINQIKKSLHQGTNIDREQTPLSAILRSDFGTWASGTIAPFQHWSKGTHHVPRGCKGKCDHSELVIVPPRRKGFTCQANGIRYCRTCAKHFKPEAGIRCLCCNQRLSSRIRSKQSRQYREQVIASKANQEETNIQNLQL